MMKKKIKEINRNKQNDTNSTILFYTQSNKYKIIFLQWSMKKIANLFFDDEKILWNDFYALRSSWNEKF